VIGGFSHKGMVSGGGGSSLVDPVGGFAVDIPLGGVNMFAPLRRLLIAGPAPTDELPEQFPTNAQVLTDAGESPADAAALARRADVAIVFAESEAENHGRPQL
jgi:beta-glucosidase